MTCISRNHGPALRWSFCLAVVLLLHIAAAMSLRRQTPRDIAEPHADNLMLDLTPMPAMPAMPPAKTAALPNKEQATPAAAVAAPAPSKPDPPKPTHQKLVRARPSVSHEILHPAASESSTEQSDELAPAAPASITAPPNRFPFGAPPADPHAVPNWQSQVLGRLQRAKQYPESARSSGDQGTAIVTFVLDRVGHVLSVTLRRSAGSPALDAEAIELIHRAAPLPPPPEAISGTTITLTVPISFALK